MNRGKYYFRGYDTIACPSLASNDESSVHNFNVSPRPKRQPQERYLLLVYPALRSSNNRNAAWQTQQSVQNSITLEMDLVHTSGSKFFVKAHDSNVASSVWQYVMHFSLL